MTKNYILLKQVGKFINVYNEDAYIISYLLNYKIINNKVGFPLSSLNKVINILDTNTINSNIKLTATSEYLENLSLKEEYRKDFEIEKIDVIKGRFNVIKRKSIDLLKTLEKLTVN